MKTQFSLENALNNVRIEYYKLMGAIAAYRENDFCADSHIYDRYSALEETINTILAAADTEASSLPAPIHKDDIPF